MKRALLELRPPSPTMIIMIDGNCRRTVDCLLDCHVRTVVGGDAILPSISAASIIAKTYRDALMVG